MVNVHCLDPNANNQSEIELENKSKSIFELSESDLLLHIQCFEKQWCLDKKGDRSIPLKIGFEQFLSSGEKDELGNPLDIDIEQISEKHRKKIKLLGDYYHRAQAGLGIFDDDSIDINGNEFKVSVRINRLIDAVDDAYESVFRYVRQYERINHPTYVPSDPENDHSKFFRCSTINIDGIDKYQELLLSLLNVTYEKELRRYNEKCYKQIIVHDGNKKYYTKAWEPLMSISDFVYHVAQKESRFEVWRNLTMKGNATSCIKHLTDCKDIQFPAMKKDRHVWSFKNGLFVGKEWSPKVGMWTTRFYPYSSDEFRSLDPTIVSSKYFDKVFPTSQGEIEFDKVDWRKIPTPNFQTILDYQDFSPDVCDWMYVMGGKMCFDVNEIDKWQIVPFLKGIARSGKSTLITKVFRKFYEAEDVKTLSNNVERKFGLGSIYDGLMFIAPEVKGDLCLEQAEFQSLVSGEDISIAIKHEKAKSVVWNTPGILGGNEVPNWKDNSGSVLRRLLTWNFGKQVEKADPHLENRLDDELPMILLKCVKAYLAFAQSDMGDKDIWNVVPKYFSKIQNQVAMVTNSLQNFMASEKVTFGKDLYVPQKLFVQTFNQHCQENNLGKAKFNPDFYAGPFSAKKLEVRSEARDYEGMAQPKQPIIFGVDLTSDGLSISTDN
jgi:hypothetical protein